MNKSANQRWLIVQIKPNSYNLAKRNLERQGFEIFLPKMNITQKKYNRFLVKSVYVFPGYMFIGFNEHNTNWTKINSTYGVSKILIFNKVPAEISSELILFLKNRYVHCNELLNQNIQKGDNIKMHTGPFVDLIAKVENVSENNRIWIVLEYAGKTKRLKLQNTNKITYNKV